MTEKLIIETFETAWSRFQTQDPIVEKFFGLDNVDKETIKSACFVFFAEGFRVGSHLLIDEMQEQLRKITNREPLRHSNNSRDTNPPI